MSLFSSSNLNTVQQDIIDTSIEIQQTIKYRYIKLHLDCATANTPV